MKKILLSAAMLTAVFLNSGCGDSATEIVGTLPVVTGIAVDTLNSRGDTIVVMWTPLDTTMVEGYFLWTRPGIEGQWTLASAVATSPAVHIANQTAYYTVMAFSGDNTSADTGLPDNTKTSGLSEIRQVFMGRPIGFRLDVTGDSLIAGDPADEGFNQQFVVAMDFLSLQRYIYPGTARPEMWPGGARTQISDRHGNVAPAPGDTVSWDDSIVYGEVFFLKLENGYYGRLDGSLTLPDTVTMTDTLVIDGELQSIMGVRVFNQI